MKRRAWQPWEIEAVLKFYADNRTDWIAQILGRTVRQVYNKAHDENLHKSRAYLASPEAHRLDGVKGLHTGFAKGHVPANKGLKGWQSGGRSLQTQFRKGNRPPTYQPVGTLTTNSNGYPKVKIGEPNRWAYLKQLVWASVHRTWPPPKGMVITYRDGDKRNCAPDNLVLISRTDLMARNTVHNYPAPIVQLIRARAQLVRKIHDQENR